MSIIVKLYQDCDGQRFITVRNSDNEKSSTLYEAYRLRAIQQDFEGRVDDEQAY